MKKKNNMRDFSLDELRLVREYISNYSHVNDIKNNLDSMIETKEQETDFNHRLTIELMEKLHFFDSEMFEILRFHGIKNIQDLIDSDLSEWDLLSQRKMELEEAKVWYDFSKMNQNNQKKKNKRK